jgi:hypothetical protein
VRISCFAPKALGTGEHMVPNRLIVGGRRNVPQVLNGVESSNALVCGRGLTQALSMSKAEILDLLPTLSPDER